MSWISSEPKDDDFYSYVAKGVETQTIKRYMHRPRIDLPNPWNIQCNYQLYYNGHNIMVLLMQ